MDDAARAVALAREWIGTPFAHGASLKGAGADCLGLIRGVWRALKGAEAEAVRPYAPHWGAVGEAEVLLEGVARHMARRPRGEALAGDVALFRLRCGGPANHAGLLACDPRGAATVIHAHSTRGVVESALCETWARRMAAVFAWPKEA